MEYNFNDIVSNVNVYGLAESCEASGYPMRTTTGVCGQMSEKDINRAHKLGMTKIGEGHDQFLTGITVQFDLTFTNKAWVEAERYRFLYFVSSCSTMHRITKFDLDSAYDKHVDARIIAIMKELVAEYNALPDDYPAELKAEKYLDVLYSNPAGFRLTARMTTNYRQLKVIYQQRRNHRLPEWRAFCKWVETLPMAELITGEM